MALSQLRQSVYLQSRGSRTSVVGNIIMYSGGPRKWYPQHWAEKSLSVVCVSRTRIHRRAEQQPLEQRPRNGRADRGRAARDELQQPLFAALRVHLLFDVI